MPLAGLVSKRIFCMHGGLSPELECFNQIRRVKRPMAVPDTGLIADLLWADPDRTAEGKTPIFLRSLRGVSEVVLRFQVFVTAGVEFRAFLDPTPWKRTAQSWISI